MELIEPKSLNVSRVYSVDILRGATVLLMVLSALVPYGNLPAWMYHAQTPPPSHGLNPHIAGLTWVDIIFPFFIFSMGVSIPFSMKTKIENGLPDSAAIWHTVKRGACLLGFAIYVGHMRPTAICSGSPIATNLLAIFFFFLMFPIWGRLPQCFSAGQKKLIKYCGIITASVLFYFMSFENGGGFSFFRNDVILFVLSNLAVVGGILWVLTRDSLLARLGVLAFINALQLSSLQEGNWINILMDQYQIPFISDYIRNNVAFINSKHFSWTCDLSWIFRWDSLKYLNVLIPGTIVGDMICNENRNCEPVKYLNSEIKYISIVVSVFMVNAIVLCGLHSRRIMFTTIAVSTLILSGLFLLKSMEHLRKDTIFRLYKFGSFWLILGLLFEPSQGGIKKDPSNLSYFFTTAGMAIITLVAIELILIISKNKYKFSLFVYNGQNPMIAYVASSNAILPVLSLTAVRQPLVGLYQVQPWVGLILACLLVLAAGYMVSIFSRSKFFLRT